MLDVQEVFAVVLHNMLIKRAEVGGWLKSLIRWTSLLLKNRRVQFRFSKRCDRTIEACVFGASRMAYLSFIESTCSIWRNCDGTKLNIQNMISNLI